MSNKLKMVTERLVDVFEQMLELREEMTCQKKKGVYAHCIAKMKEEQLETYEMNPRRMCETCLALWHMQLGKDAWVKVAKKKNPKWDPVRMIPRDQRVRNEIAPGTTLKDSGNG